MTDHGSVIFYGFFSTKKDRLFLYLGIDYDSKTFIFNTFKCSYILIESKRKSYVKKASMLL
jgi:hypothetical protein